MAEKESGMYKGMKFLSRVSLLALGVSFQRLSKICPEMQKELAGWEEGRLIAVGVLPDGPAIGVRKENGMLTYLGAGDHNAPLKILFKNQESALMALLGLIGAHTAFAEHRAIVHGSLGAAMEVNRAMAIVVKYLQPWIVLRRITKRTPKLSAAEYLIYARFMLTLTPSLVVNAFK